jgi:hypothetical protein
VRVKIKTRESLKTIKTFDRADTLAQKSKKGVSSLHNSAEQTQNVGYESETDYAGRLLQDKEECFARASLYGANEVGKWGVKETRKNIRKWRNRPIKLKSHPKLKQLPSPQRSMLTAPDKKIKKASKGTKNVGKRTKTAAKGAKTTAKATVKGTVKAAQLIKRAAIATVKFVKEAVKAIITATKATIAAIKSIIAAIVAGGWVAVLIIVIIVIMACIVGSVYAIFVPAEDNEITIFSVTRDLEQEHHKMENELAATVYYDVLSYEGSLAGWEEVIAVYAVKLNLDNDNLQEVATFDTSKAELLRGVFLDMHELSLMSETHTRYVTRQETDANGNVVEVTGEINTVYVTIITTPKSAAQIAEEYGFTAQQKEMLAALLSYENKELWKSILGNLINALQIISIFTN